MIVGNLSIAYSQELVVENISLQIKQGKMTGIIGPNGAGKSTFLKGLIGLIPCESGTVTWESRTIKEVRHKIAYVPQRNSVDLTFPITVLDTVLIGTYPKLGLIKLPRKKERQIAREALAQVEMLDFAKRQIGELSGGQLQRVFIARALAQQADIFLLDEPFVGIDMTSEALIIEVLQKLRDDGKTIIVVHHDFHKVARYFDEIILLNKQLIAYGETGSTFTEENILKTYGQGFGWGGAQ
ncbi:metal ABC transporter ATP-binding protein [Listeria grandensis]|uniref:Metal ABC transporter ATP-binding protein n=1 Tax=Listeria grandensis TaxID=1494963 RepID=A0A7X0Y1N4_9LIST|nr:metal ABC transporter ATP-binding protein [Listeria grandensis]MBC1935367.1 metal ABC transporter ATP-binding protein [Listeria grandensis]MBC6314842.1 metal ABC transporter ATP-binding protein [Listeria grandensis]